jgi:hypothetical protein
MKKTRVENLVRLPLEKNGGGFNDVAAPALQYCIFKHESQ